MPLAASSATATKHISSPFCFAVLFCFVFFPRVNFYPVMAVGKMYTQYLQVLSVLNQIMRRKMPQRQQQLQCPHIQLVHLKPNLKHGRGGSCCSPEGHVLPEENTDRDHSSGTEVQLPCSINHSLNHHSSSFCTYAHHSMM